MKNIDIRQLMSTSRVKYYEVASSLGIAETSFSRMMRKELSKEQKEKIKIAIEKILDGSENNEQ